MTTTSDGPANPDDSASPFTWWQTVGQAARPCRLSIFIAALGGWVVLAPAQTAEALAAMCDHRGPSTFAIFAVATLGWGATSWYLARVMLRFAYPDRVTVPGHRQWLYDFVARWLPRLLGIVPMICVAVSLARCRSRTSVALWPTLVMASQIVAFTVFISLRRRLLLKLKQRFEPSSRGPLVTSLWRDADALYKPNLTRLGDLPEVTLITLGCHVVVSVGLLATYACDGVGFAQWLGAPTVLVLSLSSWIACGSIITYLSSWLRVPISWLLIAEAFVLSSCFDNHVVARRESSDPVLATRQPIALDFAAWRQATHANLDTPFIVVATEGGGIRAAYWTAALLSGLEDHDPNFGSRVYAISSVSGGSLGAATFDVLLAKGSSGLRDKSARILGADFLAPPLARLLYTDLIERFLPVGGTAFDRGTALEEAWTRSLRDVVGESCFGQPFDAIWSQKPSLPRLFLNSTWVETGKRVVLSYPKPEPFYDTVDGDALASLTLVQAVHASARFPYISPALTVSGAQVTWGHLVDGGYFENSGAATAREVLAAIDDDSAARVIIIRYCDKDDKAPAALRWATELTAPPVTFFAARDARGTLALASLKGARAQYAEFCLTSNGGPPLPLGWMLSSNAQATIDRQVDQALASKAARTVHDWLQ